MRSLLFLTGIVISLATTAQNVSTTGGAAVPFTGNQLQPTYLSGLIRQPLKNLFENRNIKGSPFLSEDYKPGVVKIKNGYTQNNVPVRFNIYTNEIEFKQNNVEMSLDSVDVVQYLEKAGDSSSIRLLKAGYPAVNGNKETTIYEVLVMGEKAHLLKYSMQRIEERKVMGMPNEKVLETFTSLYLFDAQRKTLAKVKDPKEQLQSIFPKLYSTIEKTIKEKNLNLKNESDLGELVTDLNKVENSRPGH
jgi:hypothetical protein